MEQSEEGRGAVGVRMPRRGGRPRGTQPTGGDVAALAGVSRATVSRTFTPRASVDPATRARVVAAAEKLGYTPNQDARNLISGRTNTVGLVMGGFDNPFYHTVLTGFLTELHRRGLRVMCHTTNEGDGGDDATRAMRRHGVDAIVVSSHGPSPEVVEECRAAGTPVLLFNRALDGADIPSVRTDNLAGGRSVAELLHAGGCLRPAYVNGLSGSTTNRDRRAGFHDRLAELGGPAPILEHGEGSYEGGREAGRRLMLAAEPPDAVFCATDISAMGLLDALRCDLGLRVPDDVAVVGFDDVPMAGWPSFDLTTVRQRRNLMIATAMEILDGILRGDGTEARPRLLAGRLILRGSTRRRPGARSNLA